MLKDEQFPPPGTGPVQLPGWPGDVPEVHDDEVRETLAEQGWTERQVVILEPDHRWLCATLLGDYGGEGIVDVLIVVPVARLKYGPLQLEVT